MDTTDKECEPPPCVRKAEEVERLRLIVESFHSFPPGGPAHGGIGFTQVNEAKVKLRRLGYDVEIVAIKRAVLSPLKHILGP